MTAQDVNHSGGRRGLAHLRGGPGFGQSPKVFRPSLALPSASSCSWPPSVSARQSHGLRLEGCSSWSRRSLGWRRRCMKRGAAPGDSCRLLLEVPACWHARRRGGTGRRAAARRERARRARRCVVGCCGGALPAGTDVGRRVAEAVLRGDHAFHDVAGSGWAGLVLCRYLDGALHDLFLETLLRPLLRRQA